MTPTPTFEGVDVVDSSASSDEDDPMVNIFLSFESLPLMILQESWYDDEDYDISEDCPLDIFMDEALYSTEPQLPSGSPQSPAFSLLSVSSSQDSGENNARPIQSEAELTETPPALTEDDYLMVDACTAEVSAEKKPDTTWNGFKVVGDNWDKRVNPRHQTMEQKVQDHHAFQYLAVKDRVNLSAFLDSAEPRTTPLSDEHVKVMIVDAQDCEKIEENFCVLIARVLTQYMPEFEEFSSFIPSHIQHQYSHEMSCKSEIVSVIAI